MESAAFWIVMAVGRIEPDVSEENFALAKLRYITTQKLVLFIPPLQLSFPSYSYNLLSLY
jgi:hypothetical protein